MVFNIAALYSQVGTRSNRQTIEGLEEAVSSFQKAAGTLLHLSFPPFLDVSTLRTLISGQQNGEGNCHLHFFFLLSKNNSHTNGLPKYVHELSIITVQKQ